MSEEIILKVENLNVSFKENKIINNLSFELKQGEFLTILGPNGAGKTVLLRTLIGNFPYKGKIIWKPGIKFGYVPQRLAYIKNIPISIEEFFKIKGVFIKKTREILEKIGLSKKIKEEVGKLSSGEFQRLLIGWALSKDPQVLLFDEPMAGVDIKAKKTIYEFLDELKREKKLASILITHDLSVVFRLSDYVICLNKSPVCQGRPRDILSPEALYKLYGEQVKFYKHV